MTKINRVEYLRQPLATCPYTSLLAILSLLNFYQSHNLVIPSKLSSNFPESLNKLIYILEYITDTTGRLIAPLTFVMMLLTVGVVIARYVFNVGAIPVQESIVYLHGTVFMLGIAYTLRHSGHVRVDILYQRLSERGQTIVDLLGTIIFLFPVSLFILWSSLDFVAFSWSLKETSAEPGGLPYIYILKTLIPMMAILLIIQGLAELLKGVKKLRGSF